MSDKEAFEQIGNRAQELTELPQIRVKMVELARFHVSWSR